MTDGRQSYSEAYAARHGGFRLVPAAYVFLFDGDRVLLQRRSGTDYYDGWWAASAAGHVEPGESAAEAAAREAAEELGVAVGRLRPLTTMHRRGPGSGDRAVEQRVDFFFQAVEWSGDPTPSDGTADALDWFALDALPERMVHHERRVLELLAAGGLPVILPFGFDEDAAPGDDEAGAGLHYGTATVADADELLAFWAVAGENDTRPTDTADAVARLLARDADALIVARSDGRIVGTIIAGFDGWRAHLYRLAVDPGMRRRGIAAELLRRAEERLAAFGVSRVDAMVLERNELGRALWAASGYTEQLEWRRWVRAV